jgi:hypothetical protein
MIIFNLKTLSFWLAIIGLYLISDGFFSLVLVSDKHWLWQVARIIRMIAGIILLALATLIVFK